ncbi:MAG: sulfatase [Steroidobacteraceae bacterium]
MSIAPTWQPVVLVLAALSVPSTALAVSSANRPPNVVLIVADDLGYGDIGSSGNDIIATPNLDRIARRGARFTQFYASANVCSPSRAGLLTGRYPVRSGLAWDVVHAGDEGGLPTDEITIAEILRARGYATYMVGKWHLGNAMPFWPTGQGFDHFLGVPFSNDMPGFALYQDEQVIEPNVDQATLTRRFTRAAVEFIELPREQPFFLYLAHTAPHIPLHPGAGFAGKSAAGHYGDVVQELDASTGEILRALRSAGIAENTLVIFTSDNGSWWEGRSGGRGGKGETWDGGFRVPLLLAWPGEIKPASTVTVPAMNIDLLPTIAAAAGAALPADRIIDGLDLLPLTGRAGASHHHEFLYFFTNEELAGIRAGRWKLLTHAFYRQSLGALENFDLLPGFAAPYALLFDISGPTGESYDLSSRYPDVAARLNGQLQAVRAEFNALRRHAPMPVYPAR